MPNPPLDIPLEVSLLNRLLDERVRQIRGGQFIHVHRSREGDVSLDVNLLTLIPRIPKAIKLLTITATATPPGTYKCSTFSAPTTALDFTSTTQFTASQLGTSQQDNAYFINISELFRSASEPQQWDLSYILNQGDNPPAVGLWHSLAADGVPVYIGFMVALENCGQ